MMDKNAPNDDSSFGLNIVCERLTKPAVTTKKKLNKYDKRRARNLKKKGQHRIEKSPSIKEQQRLNQPHQNKASKNDTERNHLTEENECKKGGKPDDNVLERSETKEVVDKADSDKEDNSDVKAPDEYNSSDNSSVTSPAKVVATAKEPSNTATAESTTRAPSRKHHTSLLQQEEERARYMAEFHARPMEMDRRSGATGKILVSQPSHHLFDSNAEKEKEELLPGLLPKLQLACQKRFQMSQPTWIQTKTWNHFQQQQTDDKGMKNRNNRVLMIQSETGSGKTAAYLLPIVQKLATIATKKSDRKSFGIQCVILAPTRELALQIMDWVSALTQPLPPMIVGGCLSGGESRKSEKARIRKGISILVATPGRLLDHLAKTDALTIGLKTNYDAETKFLILDESDRLLDQRALGQQVQQIIQHLHSTSPSSSNFHHWSTILVSATLNPKNESHNDMIRTVLGKNSDNCASPWTWIRGQTETTKTDRSGQKTSMVDSTPRQLTQFHMMVTAKLRLTSLIAFLLQRVQNKERTVVFMATCDGVDYHYQLFRAMECLLASKSNNDDSDHKRANDNIFGCPIYRLHGQVPHAERQSILSKITSLQSNDEGMVLLATDVAARGLNLSSELHWTVQYDPPSEIAEYAHRVGRSARAGQAGHSLLFLLPSEQGLLTILQHHYNKSSDNSAIQALSLNQTLQKAARICIKDLLMLSTSKNMTEKRKGKDSNNNRDGEQFCTELQKRLEDLILQDDADSKAQAKQLQTTKKKKKREKVVGPLLEAARKAYFSHLRAYPTKEKQIRHLFSARSLHLGHVARSLGLRETPKMISTARERPTKKQEEDEMYNEKRKQKMAFDIVKEQTKGFASKKKRKMEWSNPDGTVDTAKARRLVMERAQKLQQGGMESF